MFTVIFNTKISKFFSHTICLGDFVRFLQQKAIICWHRIGLCNANKLILCEVQNESLCIK